MPKRVKKPLIIPNLLDETIHKLATEIADSIKAGLRSANDDYCTYKPGDNTTAYIEKKIRDALCEPTTITRFKDFSSSDNNNKSDDS